MHPWRHHTVPCYSHQTDNESNVHQPIHKAAVSNGRWLLVHINIFCHLLAVLMMGGWWRWALASPHGVAPSWMVSVSASVNLPLHLEVQKFSSGTGSPGWSWKNGCKMAVVWCGGGFACPHACCFLYANIYHVWIWNNGMARWQDFEAVAFRNGISDSVGKFTANTILLLSHTFYGLPYGMEHTIIFSSCGFFLYSMFFFIA